MLRPRRDIHPAIVSRIKVMAKMDIAEHRMPQDGRCHVVVEGKEIDLRISTLPTVLGEKVVLRVLDKQRSRSISTSWACRRACSTRGQETAAQAVRAGAGHRPDRQRQDDDAVLGAGTDQDRSIATSSRSKIRSSTSSS